MNQLVGWMAVKKENLTELPENIDSYKFDWIQINGEKHNFEGAYFLGQTKKESSKDFIMEVRGSLDKEPAKYDISIETEDLIEDKGDSKPSGTITGKIIRKENYEKIEEQIEKDKVLIRSVEEVDGQKAYCIDSFNEEIEKDIERLLEDFEKIREYKIKT